MSERVNQSSGSVRKKVIFVFLCCFAALILAWLTSRVAFREILATVDNISAPNKKLSLVSQVSRDIMQLDQLQRSQALLNNQASYRSFVKESNAISLSLDSLADLYTGDKSQIGRINAIKGLLRRRDRLFNEYIKVREKLVNGEEFSNQLQSLDSLFYLPSQDSTVVTTEKKKSSTTFNPETGEAASDNRGFFARLFGSRKKSEPLPERQTVKEEVNVIIDSIAKTLPDSIKSQIDSTLQVIRDNQRRQSEIFTSREIELTLAGNALISNMLNTLQSVENEAMKQMVVDNMQARSVVNSSVLRIGIIILSFFLIISVLIYLILDDIRKSNAYRRALELAKEEAEYHSAAKQRFLSNMSHELRTPLQSIIGYTEQLKQESQPDPRKVEVVYQSSEHLLQIVNEVLDYNRITSGKIVLNNQPFYLGEVIKEVMAAMKPQAEKKDLLLEQHLRIYGTGYVEGDAFRIKQILFNLLSNAIKFTDQGKVTLNLSTAIYSGTTRLSAVVKDTGKGISKTDMGRIFNEFEQAENANSGTNFGSGLGLSIVKTICESMGGSIEAQSKQGFGSAFSIDIPLKTADERLELPGADLPAEAAHPFENTVWVVDDDAFILSLCHTILSKHGVKHRCFASPDELLATPLDPDVRVILLDMRMPGKTGAELQEVLRDQVSDEVKIYAFTAQVLPEEQEKLLEQGFDGLLLKPFKEQALLKLLGVPVVAAKAAAVNNGYELPADLEKIKELTYHDEQQFRKIIRLYIQDTQTDLGSMEKCLEEGDSDQCSLLFHRMAGRTAQIGGTKQAFNLRQLETESRQGTIPSAETIQELTSQMQELLAFLELSVKTDTETSTV